MYIGLHVKYPYSCQILIKLEFDRFSKNQQIQNFMTIPSVAAELFHVYVRTYRQIDRQAHNNNKANICFSQFY
jgi:hypothetical protein